MGKKTLLNIVWNIYLMILEYESGQSRVERDFTIAVESRYEHEKAETHLMVRVVIERED